MKKYRVTLNTNGAGSLPADFAFVSAEVTVMATSAERAEDFARAFLVPHMIGVFADVDEVTELAS